MTVVSAATTSTTNITGFLTINRGSSFVRAEPIAGKTILGSIIAETGTRFCSFMTSMDVTPNDRSEQIAGRHRQRLDDRPERERREEGETADDQDYADDQADEQAARRRQGAGRRRNRLLAGERTRHRHRRNDHEEAADKHRTRQREIIEEGVAAKTREGRTVVAGRRGVGIQHLRKTMRAGIGD